MLQRKKIQGCASLSILRRAARVEIPSLSWRKDSRQHILAQPLRLLGCAAVCFRHVETIAAKHMGNAVQPLAVSVLIALRLRQKMGCAPLWKTSLFPKT